MKSFMKLGAHTLAILPLLFSFSIAHAAQARFYTLASTSIASVSNSPSFVCSATFGDVRFAQNSVQQVDGMLYLNGRENRKLVLTVDDLEGKGLYQMKIWLVNPNGEYSATGWVALGRCHLN